MGHSRNLFFFFIFSFQQLTVDMFIIKFYSCHLTFTDKKVSRIHGRKNVTISLRVSLTRLGEVRLGYLDVAIAKKIRKTRMPSCAIDSRQRLFWCSHCEKHLSVKLAKNICQWLAKNICQWNLRKFLKICQWKTVARMFCQWKLGAPFY